MGRFFKGGIAREDAYGNVGNEMNIDGFELTETKAKIKSLRNAYVPELAKIKKRQDICSRNG